MKLAARTRVVARAPGLWVLSGLALILTAGVAAVGQQPSGGPLHVCHAGSLSAAFSAVAQEFTKQHPGTSLNDVSGGSVALARRIAAGAQPCDVFAAADYLNIDLLLKPAGLADFTIVFAKGRMVLAYLATDPLTRGIAAPGDFNPPASIPQAAPDWYRRVIAPGARIAGSHPFLDPSGYRSHLIFELAQRYYDMPNLYGLLLEHYTIIPAVGGTTPGRALGEAYNFQFTYEHGAAAAATTNPSYRYVTVPDRIDLSTSGNNEHYRHAAVAIPPIGARDAASTVSIPGTRVAWGITIPRNARSPELATAFVNLLLGSAGAAALAAHGPAPVSPALVTASDYARLPTSLQSLVKAGQIAP